MDQLHDIDKLLDEIEDNEDKKDRELIINVLKRMSERGNNIKKILWQMMYCEYIKQNQTEQNQNVNENENENNNENDNKSDAKSEQKEYEKEHEKELNDYNNNNVISQLTNTKYTEMCKHGHGRFNADWVEYYGISDNCVQCGSDNGRKICEDCNWYYSYLKLTEFIYCENCRKAHAEKIKNKIKFDGFKAKIIRDELVKNPYLEMDLLVNMPRKASLDTLINDINRLEPQRRSQWCLLALDMDHLKAWNDCIGHVATDQLIKKIGNIMSTYVTEVNNGEWKANDKGSRLDQAFIYRTGGDEFVMVLKCEVAAVECKLSTFYTKMKTEINRLGLNIKQFVLGDHEWSEAMQKLKKAKDRKGNDLDMGLVGISMGLYIPDPVEAKEKDWLSKADKVALKHAKITNEPKKNSFAIYYEQFGSLISDEKQEKCFEIGLLNGLK